MVNWVVRQSSDGNLSGERSGEVGRETWHACLEYENHVPMNLTSAVQYRLIAKYMLQHCLMKLNRINRDENDLSFNIVSIALTYLLNAPHSNLKYAIQFFLIDTSQNLLQELKN
jgi:hypothetical protein